MDPTQSILQFPGNEDDPRIYIQICDLMGAFVVYLLKPETKASVFIEKYARQVGKHKRSLRFVYDGDNISPSDTLLEIGIKSHGVIDVVFDQTGG